MSSPVPDVESWPSLPYEAWKSACRTLHLWTQVVGKVRFSQSPWINHSWGVTLYLTARGLTTSPMPNGAGTFQTDFDFIDHELSIVTSDGRKTGFPLRPRSVADFYRNLMHELETLGIHPEFSPMPNEIPYGFPLPGPIAPLPAPSSRASRPVPGRNRAETPREEAL
jgi:hypothetical protein